MGDFDKIIEYFKNGDIMKISIFTTVFALFIIASIVTGCETGQNSQQAATPTTTVSGYVSIGGAKTVH